ncbi:TPM domain-containing protein [Anoxynatronum sibiricum]|uniref:TPM domain-containing protein n=1 Tax=Anoxynatronum sibiricum TaxID=210623 RepID=A0ABU9VP18_9CLOT
MQTFLTITLLWLLIGSSWAAGLASSHVVDEYDVLSQSDIDALQQQIDSLAADHGLDVVIVITDQVAGKSSRDFADDYYDNNGYGIGPEASGLLMLVNMAEREVWISTTGEAIDIFTDQRIDTINDSVVEHLADGAFHAAAQTFLNQVDVYARQGVPAGQYREPETPPEPVSFWGKLLQMALYWPIFVAALIVSAVSTIAISAGHRVMPKTSASAYQPPSGFTITSVQDRFLRETTNRVKIASSSSSGGSSTGGRSTTHSSSSGRTHGGGGKKF